MIIFDSFFSFKHSLFKATKVQKTTQTTAAFTTYFSVGIFFCLYLVSQILFFQHIMSLKSEEIILSETRQWVKQVVIGANFCPFAAKPFLKNEIRFVCLTGNDTEAHLTTLIAECEYLDAHDETETTLLVFPDGYASFDDFLDLVDMAEALLEEQEYEGIYQLASFHPDYLFADAEEDDPANYTNRSLYPMLHLLRESSVSFAVEQHPDVEAIPERNVEYARKKGLAFMQQLRAACLSENNP